MCQQQKSGSTGALPGTEAVVKGRSKGEWRWRTPEETFSQELRADATLVAAAMVFRFSVCREKEWAQETSMRRLSRWSYSKKGLRPRGFAKHGESGCIALLSRRRLTLDSRHGANVPCGEAQH